MYTVSRINSEVRHGTVLFSTRTAPVLACKAISRVTASNAVTSVARPAPSPLVFVGVFTAISIISASPIYFETSVEKCKFGSRAGMLNSLKSAHWLSHSDVEELDDDPADNDKTWDCCAVLQDREPSRPIRRMYSSPGSWIGKCLEFHCAIRLGSRSTTVTLMCGFWKAIMAAVGPPIHYKLLDLI